MMLVKLGGSVITDKSVPLSFQGDAVKAMAGAISEVAGTEPVILVHGGGSFGHYYSVIHDMHTRPARYDVKGFAMVRNSMMHLHHLVLDALTAGGVIPYGCSPSTLVYSSDAPYPDAMPDRVSKERVLEVGAISAAGLCPVLYGDAIWCGDGKSRIISGDEIMVLLSQLLDVRLAVFAMDVDGLYTDMESGRLVRHVGAGEASSILHGASVTHDATHDVTGGMLRKVRAAHDISAAGADVLFVNGNKPRRIADTIHDKYEGTLFAGVAGVEA